MNEKGGRAITRAAPNQEEEEWSTRWGGATTLRELRRRDMRAGRIGRLARRLSAASLGLVCACLALQPATAFADPTVHAGVTDSSVCSVNVSLQFTVPVTSMPSLAEPGVTVNASGTCNGVVPNVPLFLQAGGWTPVAPTCTLLTPGAAGGTLTLGATPYGINTAVGGSTAMPEMAVGPATIGVSGVSVSGTASLTITPESLQQCLQPGGTTLLQYTGILTLAG